MSTQSQVVSGNYVVGMTWRPLVARGDMDQLAKKKAREERANWYSHRRAEQIVGAARLPGKAKPPKGMSFFSAARIACTLSPYGVSFFAIRLEDQDQVWVCGVKDGAPVNGFDELVTEEVAPQVLQRFMEQMGITEAEVEVRGDTSGLPQTSIPQEWADIMAAPTDTAALLPTAESVWQSIPPGLRLVLMALVALMVINTIWGKYKSMQVQKRLAAEAAANEVDAVQEWRLAVQKWAGQRTGMGYDGVQAWRQAVGAMPLSLAGWSLKDVDCQAMLAGGWACQARYDNSQGQGLDPTVNGFNEQRPADWQVLAKDMDLLEVTFKVAHPVARIDLSQVKTTQQHLVETVSLMQRVRRAFKGVALGTFVAARIDPPIAPNGSPVPLAPGFALPSTAKVKFDGPMRSLDAAEIAALPVSWNHIRLLVETGNKKGAATLNQSQLMITAEGDIYAR